MQIFSPGFRQDLLSNVNTLNRSCKEKIIHWLISVNSGKDLFKYKVLLNYYYKNL